MVLKVKGAIEKDCHDLPPGAMMLLLKMLLLGISSVFFSLMAQNDGCKIFPEAALMLLCSRANDADVQNRSFTRIY